MWVQMDRSLHTATPCPDFKSTKSCPRGDRCTMAHGPWEAGLHPDAFKTNLCAYGKGCQRRMCFFAHDGCELRSPQPGASQQLMQQPALQQQCTPVQGPNSMQNQWHGPGKQHLNYSNAPGAMLKGGGANHRGRSSMVASQGPKNGMVPGPHDHALSMGFGEISAPADRKSREAGMASKTWAPVAQGPGAVHGLGNQPHMNTAGMPNQRQAGRGLNSHKGGSPNASAASGSPNVGPGGKHNNNGRRASNMRGMAVYNASRMAGPQPAGAQGTPHEVHDGELKGNSSSAGASPLAAAEGRGAKGGVSQSPEWIKQEDTSWVDKLLDSPFDAM